MSTRVGYTGGAKKNPTYHSLGDHTETVDMEYDPSVISYGDLLDIFWRNHSATFPKSTQYMSAVFCHGETQLRAAQKSKEEQEANTKETIYTKIVLAERFYDAEDYHQKYMLRNNRILLKSLNLSEREILKSHVAAKLNGYVSGSGNVEDFEKDKVNFGLNPDQIDYVVRQMSGRRGR